MTRFTLTRQQLYDRVWATPVETLAHELGLSGRGLGKLCARLKIPVPPRGYWAKRAAGHRVSQPRLPVLQGGHPSPIEFDLNPAASGDGRQPEAHPLISFEHDLANQLSVPENVPLTDPRVLRAQRVLARARRDSTGLTLAPARTLQVRAARTEHERALRILQSLLAALQARGFPIKDTADGVRVVILDELLGFGIEEQLNKVAHRATPKEQGLINRGFGYGIPKFDHVPSGRLTLVVTNVRGTRQRWSDRPSRRLEHLLNRFIIGLIRAALVLKQPRADAEQREREHQERERLRQEEAARAQAAHLLWREEQAKTERLLQLAAVSERHQRLRAVVADLQAAVGPVGPDTALGKWLSWANDHVNRSDPFARLKGLDQEESLELYYYGYDCDRLVEADFEEPDSEGWGGKEPKSGIKLTNRPPSTSERALKVVIPWGHAVPYEWPQESNWYWRVFRVPAAVLNEARRPQ